MDVASSDNHLKACFKISLHDCSLYNSWWDFFIEKKVIVMDAGGTNFRVAAVHFDKDKNAQIEDFKLHEMPGIEKEGFFASFASLAESF